MATTDKFPAIGLENNFPAHGHRLLSLCSRSLTYIFLSAILAGAELPDGYAPLPTALIAAVGPGSAGIFALLGSLLGHLSFQGFPSGLRDMAACILIFSVSFAFFDTKFYRFIWSMPAMTVGITAVTGFISLSDGRLRPAGIACYLTSLLLAGGAAYYYRTALSALDLPKGERPSHRQIVSLLLLGMTLLMSLAKVRLLSGLSLGCILAGTVVLTAALLEGMGGGAAAGVCAGLAMDLAMGKPLYSLTLGISGLFAGVFHKQGRLAMALAYVLLNGVVTLWLWDSVPTVADLLYETFATSVLFAALPDRLFRTLRANWWEPDDSLRQERRKAFVRTRLEHTAAAFGQVYATLRDTFSPGKSDSVDDPSVISRRAVDRVCAHCSLKESCWQRDYQSTANAFNHCLSAMLEQGRAQAADFPGWFSARCIRLPQMLDALNEEQTAFLYQRRYHARLRESRAAVCRQYEQLSRVLEDAALELGQELSPDPVRERKLRQFLAGQDVDGECSVFRDKLGRLRAEILLRDPTPLLSEEMPQSLSRLLQIPLHPPVSHPERSFTRLVFTQAEPLAVIAGVAAKKKDGEAVSGDAGAWFKGEDGVLYLLLCDGMGSGPNAGRESDLAIHLLEKFLRAGVDPLSALKTLNTALALRAEKDGGFTTVDLCRLDLFTGQAAVYKYGAAPTYIKKGDAVLRVVGSTLPAGMVQEHRGEPDVTPFSLAPGDLAVMVTDGVTDGEKDEWFRECLAGLSHATPKELARVLLERSSAHASSPDDRTVMVLQVVLRE